MIQKPNFSGKQGFLPEDLKLQNYSQKSCIMRILFGSHQHKQNISDAQVQIDTETIYGPLGHLCEIKCRCIAIKNLLESNCNVESKYYKTSPVTFIRGLSASVTDSILAEFLHTSLYFP